MKYKLIKCYPGSPKLGYITNFDENEEDWNTENLIIPPDCTDYPEFWEEIKEKEFEILKISSKKENDTYDFGTVITFLDTEEPFDKGWQKYWDIYSIKRLSDGKIFSIGDKVNNPKLRIEQPFIIKKFCFDCNNKHILALGGNGGINITKIEHVKEPSFITEDGKNIYCGDNFWFVDNFWNIGKGVVTHPVFKPLYGYKQFSSEDLARKYVEEHKPQFSKNDMVDFGKRCFSHGRTRSYNFTVEEMLRYFNNEKQNSDEV